MFERPPGVDLHAPIQPFSAGLKQAQQKVQEVRAKVERPPITAQPIAPAIANPITASPLPFPIP